jgi:4'-phosphopantetheinyl transferase
MTEKNSCNSQYALNVTLYSRIRHQIIFVSNEYGKPMLQHDIIVHFNVSHSGDRCVCAIDKEPVGIDVEAVQSIDPHVAMRRFSDEEINKTSSISSLYYY